MSALFKDPLFYAQWLRTAGHAAAGGADLGECIKAAETIREPDFESWRTVWTRLGARVLAEAEASLSSGHTVSAATAFLKASNYFRTSYVFQMGPNPDRRLLDAYRQQRERLRKEPSPRVLGGAKPSPSPSRAARFTAISLLAPVRRRDRPWC